MKQPTAFLAAALIGLIWGTVWCISWILSQSTRILFQSTRRLSTIARGFASACRWVDNKMDEVFRIWLN